MTLGADLTALLTATGILDVDIEEVVEDEHVRGQVYRQIIAEITALPHRDNDVTIVTTILRDPSELTSKTALVQLVDNVAMRATDPAEFQQWAAGLIPETHPLKREGSREFLHRRIHDWTVFLAIKAGQTPTALELGDITGWMQRKLAEESNSLPVLTSISEGGRTKRIRNIAKNRVRSRGIRTNIDSGELYRSTKEE